MKERASARAGIDWHSAREVRFGVPMPIDSWNRRLCGLTAAAALAACASERAPLEQLAVPVESVAAPSAPDAPAPPPPPPTLELPGDWDRIAREPFEDAARTWLPDGERTSLAPATIATLSSALGDAGERSVRAAILLGRSRDPAAQEALLANLERRVDRVLRSDPTGSAPDFIAAAALHEPDPSVRDCPARLETLGLGPKPHPDVSVRVECAAAALAQGRTRTIAFLLRILREGTTTQAARVDWSRAQDIAFAQVRADEALARRAGVDARFRPDASAAARSAEADRLERILVPPRPKKR